MSNVTNLNVECSQLTKYGFQTPQGEYINWSKTCTDQARVVPGGEYEMVMFIADSGKKYCNKVVGEVSKKPKAETKRIETPAVDTERAKKFTPKYEKKAEATSAGLTKEEWANKDQRISRQGVIQAAVQAVAPMVALENVFTEADRLATQMLEFVNRKA